MLRLAIAANQKGAWFGLVSGHLEGAFCAPHPALNFTTFPEVGNFGEHGGLTPTNYARSLLEATMNGISSDLWW